MNEMTSIYKVIYLIIMLLHLRAKQNSHFQMALLALSWGRAQVI